MKTSKDLTTNWRKVASTIYRKPVDSKIFGEVEIDVTDLEKFISEQRGPLSSFSRRSTGALQKPRGGGFNRLFVKVDE